MTALAPAAARAATVELSGGSLRYTANPGEANVVTIASAGGTFMVSDPGVLSLTPGFGCTLAAVTRVTCPSSGVSSVSVDAGDGDDTVDLSGVSVPATLIDGAGNDTVTGGSGNDTFVGSAGDDVLNGGAGNDTFGDAGGAGADTISGGVGIDTADYGSRTVALAVSLDGQPNDGAAGEGDNVRPDVETVNGGLAADRLAGSPGNDTLRGGGGDDVIDGGLGADTIAGGSGNDTVDYSGRTAAVTVTLDGLANDGAAGEGDNVGADVQVVQGGAGDDSLTGGSGTDELDGNGGDDVLSGGGGNDVVHGGAGADRLDGGTGNDTLDGGAGADAAYGGAGTDVLDYSSRGAPVTADLTRADGFGEAGEGDTVPARDVEGVYGGAGDDALTGSAGANVLRGNAGNDTLDGGLGADDVGGGDGVDSVTYAGRTAGVTVRLDNSANDGAWGEADNVRNDVEDVTGGRGDDHIYADDAANVIDGGGGDDQVWGYGGDDTITLGDGAVQAWGGSGDDAIAAGDGAAKLYGEDGNDRVTAGGGPATLDGGNGDDVLTAGDGGAKLTGDAGNDTLSSGVGNDSLDGGSGDDALAAGAGNDTLNGSAGNDALDGADGNDVLNGGDGNDHLIAGAGADKLYGGAGSDGLDAGAGDDTADAGGGDDLVGGGDGNDTLSGGDGNDTIDGGAGDDSVSGWSGNDAVRGGDGNDHLAGGSGDDVLDGGSGADAISGDDGDDTVDYGSRTAAVAVTNDGTADDGERGEGDNVAATIDNAIGGAGDDRIVFAVDFPHHLDGGAGNDTLRGGPASDTLTGGRGNDRLTGDGGRDAYDGGSGADRISSTDGVTETLDCGGGTDVSVQDRTDQAVSCEHRKIGKLAPPPAPAPDPQEVTHSPAPGNAIPISTVRAPSGLVGVRRVSSGRFFTAIPGFPGMRADRRIIPDILWIVQRYHVRITAAFAMTGHADGGEHPRGLAVDLVPGPGGSWDDVDRLAKWAEPRQNHPRPPFRWVGYNGDPNHGRGNHLHLSWMHAPDAKGVPAAWVIALRFLHGRPSPARPRRPATGPGLARGAGALRRYASSSNARLGGHPSYASGLHAIRACSGADALKPTLRAAARAFGLRWSILAGVASVESAFGCNMGPSSAGAIGWTQFMPATWRMWGMDADGDRRASPYDSVDAVFSTARYLSASGAPRSYRRALFAYNHSWAYVRTVLARARLFA